MAGSAAQAESTVAILRQLEAAGVAFRLFEHEAVTTIDDARARVPHLTVNLLKTVVFEVRGRAGYVLVAVGCEDQVDYRGVAAALECSRRALRLVPGERVEAELGFEVGGVGPFRLRDDVTVLLDERLRQDASVKVGAGARTLTLELSLADLRAVSDGAVAAVAKSAPS
ncbi:MAG: aminoacyl-tRNA deacylase [Gammaproteobacteria bacterium]